ncbi:substrate-binding domain-containing protein [Georgenia sp. TF02-10]|uniref:LacI family DNA-binding transcriptional regulator n=1 Tax=Georgenia sp. TF02-10 TaxID=2917725 RepID=UPI001FA75122|nr:substrate-binding domain-containing protein [Georgenia sp. TF02-10]UNX53623.1 substrate-binding domain-containing protein [Georgenia sp. TF02-10]
MHPETPRRLRLQDVAERVGVSAKTVSNAYRQPGQLRPELRRRILETAAAMGYRGPDPIAAGLRRRPTGPIGVLYANPLAYAFDDPNTNQLLGGLSTTAQAAGRGLLLLPGSSAAKDRSTAIEEAVVDGVVASSLADDDPLLLTTIERHLPLVVVDQPRPARLAALVAGGTPWVGIDDHGAAQEIAEHVLGLGHRRIGVVSFALRAGPTPVLAEPRDQDTATLAVTRDRLAGYRAAAARHGIDWTAVPVSQGTDSTPDEGYRGAMAVLDRRPRPTALICLSDRLAEGAIAAVRQHGLRVPEEVTVVGFDDAPQLADRLGLTTVHQPSRRKGQLAAAALLDLLRGHPAAGQVTLPTHLVTRTSSAPPPAAA